MRRFVIQWSVAPFRLSCRYPRSTTFVGVWEKRTIEFSDEPPAEERKHLGNLFVLKRDYALRAAADGDVDEEARVSRARAAAWVWPEWNPFLTVGDLTQEEARILKKRKGGKDFVDIARKLALLGEFVPKGERAILETPAPPLEPAEIERRMIQAFLKDRLPAIAPVSSENGTRQTPQRDSFAFVDDRPKNVIGPTTGGGQWPVYAEVDPDELKVFCEGLEEAPELMWVAGVLADRLWALHSLKVFNRSDIDDQVTSWIVQWERDPAVEAARRIVVRCLREGVNPNAYVKARSVYYPALAKRLQAEGVNLVSPTMIQRSRRYGPDIIVGLDEIAARAGLVKTEMLLRGFVRGKTPLAYRGGQFVTTKAVIRTRPERERKRAVGIRRVGLT
jgi:hypothetical protein